MEVVCNWLTAHMQSNNHFRDVVKDTGLKVKYEAWTNVNSTCSVDTHSDIGLLYYYRRCKGFFFCYLAGQYDGAGHTLHVPSGDITETLQQECYNKNTHFLFKISLLHISQ